MHNNFTEKHENNNIIITAPALDIPRTLDCGQAFRWSEKNGVWHGVAGGRVLDICQSENEITFLNTSQSDFDLFWRPYFDLDRDYTAITERFMADQALANAVKCCPGIRILHQEPFEALISFIISQNNNIPRIKGIVERLCALCGEQLNENDFAFPTAEKIAALGVEGLAPIRAGFRAKYIINAAERVASGETRLYEIEKLPIDEARAELMKITGVGPKVAECCLLYGMGRVEAFPVDVWVKRIMAELYPNGLPECTYGVQGIAQQFLFHWRRTVE